eukprot:363544-Chlamydomonas_euryale.AAC.7
MDNKNATNTCASNLAGGHTLLWAGEGSDIHGQAGRPHCCGQAKVQTYTARLGAHTICLAVVTEQRQVVT